MIHYLTTLTPIPQWFLILSTFVIIILMLYLMTIVKKYKRAVSDYYWKGRDEGFEACDKMVDQRITAYAETIGKSHDELWEYLLQ